MTLPLDTAFDQAMRSPAPAPVDAFEGLNSTDKPSPSISDAFDFVMKQSASVTSPDADTADSLLFSDIFDSVMEVPPAPDEPCESHEVIGPSFSDAFAFAMNKSGELDDDGGGVLEERSTLPRDIEFDLAMSTHGIGEVTDLSANPAYEDQLARRVADLQPLKHKEYAPTLRQFNIDFGPSWAPAGSIVQINYAPQCKFRAEKLMATDTAADPGTGTLIMNVTVGRKIQRPGNAQGSLTKFFSETSRADGIRFDTANPWENVVMTVQFVQACTFQATVFGTAETE